MSWNEHLREKLKGTFTGKIIFDEPAALRTSIHVGGKIDALVFPENIEELSAVVKFADLERIPFLPVGNWTNLIVRDGGFRGIIISLTGMRKLHIEPAVGRKFLISAEAGCPLAEMAKTAAEESLSGAEFCSGIPGSVGGAIRMNAGAYGGEIKDIAEQITIIDKSGRIKTTARNELNFTYRNLDLPEGSIIITGNFILTQANKNEIVTKMADIIRNRKEKHPLDWPNAGSIFKNLPESPAGLLIEQAGLKGLRIGDAQISEKHSNFIVNRGAASAQNILELIMIVKRTVFEKTGRLLETEVKVVGENEASLQES